MRQTYLVLLAFLEDVVLGHAHCLHDQFHPLQLDVAILRQIALDQRTRVRTPQWQRQEARGQRSAHPSLVHHVLVDVDQPIDGSLPEDTSRRVRTLCAPSRQRKAGTHLISKDGR